MPFPDPPVTDSNIYKIKNPVLIQHGAKIAVPPVFITQGKLTLPRPVTEALRERLLEFL